MIRVGENSLCASLGELLRSERFHGRLRGDWHKRWRVNSSVLCVENPGPRTALLILQNYLKVHRLHRNFQNRNHHAFRRGASFPDYGYIL
jgi:hypothetical protein